MILSKFCIYTKNDYICIIIPRPDGGIGRRVGLKHQWIHFHPGSIPGLGTKLRILNARVLFYFSSTSRNSTRLVEKASLPIDKIYIFRGVDEMSRIRLPFCGTGTGDAVKVIHRPPHQIFNVRHQAVPQLGQGIFHPRRHLGMHVSRHQTV